MDYVTGAPLSFGVLLALANGKQRQGSEGWGRQRLACILHAHFLVSMVCQELYSVVSASVGRVLSLGSAKMIPLLCSFRFRGGRASYCRYQANSSNNKSDR